MLRSFKLPYVHELHFQRLRTQLTESVLVTVEVILSENKNRCKVSPRKSYVCLNSAEVL